MLFHQETSGGCIVVSGESERIKTLFSKVGTCI